MIPQFTIDTSHAERMVMSRRLSPLDYAKMLTEVAIATAVFGVLQAGDMEVELMIEDLWEDKGGES